MTALEAVVLYLGALTVTVAIGMFIGQQWFTLTFDGSGGSTDEVGLGGRRGGRKAPSTSVDL
jgi:hypothetical protein